MLDCEASCVADQNRALFESAVRLLTRLLDDLVFLGGCTTGVFLTHPAAGVVRPTRDVDAIVDVTSYAKYTLLAERLRAVGFVEDRTPGAPLCRWRRDEVIVDVMPVDPGVLGFSNRWYATAIETAQTWRIAEHDVRIVTPPLFIATKLEAFRGRGRGDVYESHDLEDIVTVIDGRAEIVEEVAAAPLKVRSYISSEIAALVANPDFIDALSRFLMPDAASQARRPLLEHRLRALAEL